MKNLKKLGKSLSKVEQKSITGGSGSTCGGPSPADLASGFPPTCVEGEEYLLPPCNFEQQQLADSGCSYWKCVCGKAAGVKDDFLTKPIK